MHFLSRIISKIVLAAGVLLFLARAVSFAQNNEHSPVAYPVEATITATGETVADKVYISSVVIGKDRIAENTNPYPPPPPEYTTQIRLFRVGDFANPYNKDIRWSTPHQREAYVIEVDPDGNTPNPPTGRTTTISWSATELENLQMGDLVAGFWTLRQGFNGRGAVLIANMSITTSLTVTGTSELYFTITSPSLTDAVENRAEEQNLPKYFVLQQNHPNPFSRHSGMATQIRYELPRTSPVAIQIYNLTGQLLRTLVESRQIAGHYTVTWDGRDETGKSLPSGLYLYKMTAGEFTATRRLVLLR